MLKISISKVLASRAFSKFYLEFMIARIIFPFDFINDKSLPDNIPILLIKIIMHARRERQIIIKELVI